jgi:hypothetical protein
VLGCPGSEDSRGVPHRLPEVSFDAQIAKLGYGFHRSCISIKLYNDTLSCLTSMVKLVIEFI